MSKILLKPAEITKLYAGPERVLLIMEKGMYEYHLNAGYSPDAARIFKQQSGVTGASIVSYRNAKRIDIKGAF